VLEVGEPHLGAGVEGVDRHLALGRAGDLDPAVEEVDRCCRHLPVAVADLAGRVEEVQATTAGHLGASGPAGGQELVTTPAEPSLQLRQELQRLRREDLGTALDLWTADRHVAHAWQSNPLEVAPSRWADRLGPTSPREA